MWDDRIGKWSASECVVCNTGGNGGGGAGAVGGNAGPGGGNYGGGNGGAGKDISSPRLPRSVIYIYVQMRVIRFYRHGPQLHRLHRELCFRS